MSEKDVRELIKLVRVISLYFLQEVLISLQTLHLLLNSLLMLLERDKPLLSLVDFPLFLEDSISLISSCLFISLLLCVLLQQEG